MNHTSVDSLLIIGSYSGARSDGIHAFAFDGETGQATRIGAHSGVEAPSFLALHPNGAWLYTVSETQSSGRGPGSVAALRMSRAPFSLEIVGMAPSGGDLPCHLALDPSGRWLVVSNYGTGTVAVFPIREDGSLGAMTDLVQHQGAGPDPQRQTSPHAHSATFSPDGRFVLVADLGIDQVVVYRFDPGAGALRPHGHARLAPGAGPRHLAFHPSGRMCYVGNELDNTVAIFAYEAAAGALRLVGAAPSLPAGAPLSYIAHIAVDPAGQHAYASNRGHDSIAAFDIAADGLLGRARTPPCGGAWPRHFALAPGGRFLLAANQHSDGVAVLPTDATRGLGAPADTIAVEKPSCVLFA